MKALIRSKLALTLITMILLAGAIVLPLSNSIHHSHAASSSSQASWHIVSSPSPSTNANVLNAVSAYDANNVWAVGLYGNTDGSLHDLIEHWNGTSWSLQTGANPGANGNYLYGVKALSATDIWAVGFYKDAINSSHALIEHSTDGGNTWSQDTNSYTGEGYLYGIDGDPSTGDAWAVGSDGTLNALTLHLVNGHFSSQTNVSPSYGTLILNGVSEHSSSDVWAVGSYLYGGGYHNIDTMHYDGNSWTEYSDPISSYATGENSLSGVTTIGTDNAWGVGSIGPVRSGYQDHWNGTAWSNSTSSSCSIGQISGLSSIAFSNSDNIWAAGYSNYYYNNTYFPLICHSSDGGTTWEQSSLENPSDVHNYNAFNGIDFDKNSGIGWAVGTAGNFTLIEQYTPSTTPPSITVNPTQGSSGVTVTVTGSSWTSGDVVDISLSTSASVLTKATVAGDGTFSTSFTVPVKAATGTQFVNAKDETTGQTAQTAFTVTRGKLFVLVQGIKSKLTPDQATMRNGDGEGDDFFATKNNVIGIAPYLQTNGYQDARFIMFSYTGYVSNGQPLSYTCRNTFVNTVLSEAKQLGKQINAALQENPNQDVYIIAHSQGGLIAMTYLTALIETQGIVAPLPTGAKLQAIVTLDSPIGGVENTKEYLSDSETVFRILCGDLLSKDKLTSLKNMANLFPSATNIDAQGETASILAQFLDGSNVSNQKVMEDARKQGVSILTFSNLIDLLWLPKTACGLTTPDFPSTAWVNDEGSNSGIYHRSITSGSYFCWIAARNIANHLDVLNNTFVERAIGVFLAGNTPPNY